MSKIAEKSSRIKFSQSFDQQTLKSIVESFLQWYNAWFGTCLEDIKKFPGYSSLIEDLFDNNGGFEVNEETLYNILSAELQGSSEIHSFYTCRIIPTIPKSIANATNLRQKTYSFNLNENLKRNSKSMNLFTSESYEIVPKKFRNTEDLCKNLKYLRIVEKFTQS